MYRLVRRSCVLTSACTASLPFSAHAVAIKRIILDETNVDEDAEQLLCHTRKATNHEKRR